MTAPCVFCAIIGGHEPGEVLQVWDDAIALRPLNPTADDHALIIPRRHVADATTDPVTTAMTARRAAQRARPGQHITANIGAGAGQSVFHLHWHVFSCRGRGRCMPWGCPAEVRASGRFPVIEPDPPRKPRLTLDEHRQLVAREAAMRSAPDRPEDPDA